MALDVELTTVQGRWLRHAPASADPALRPVPADDNRWQRGSVVDALYLCDELACVWAEWYRDLAERGIPPQMALPRDVWNYEVDALEVADLRTAERLARVGLLLPTPGRRGWPAFQAIGEQRCDPWRPAPGRPARACRPGAGTPDRDAALTRLDTE